MSGVYEKCYLYNGVHVEMSPCSHSKVEGQGSWGLKTMAFRGIYNARGKDGARSPV